MKPDFTLKFVKDSADLRRFTDALVNLSVFALDIETVDWWNRHQERIALMQFAYRSAEKIRVVIVDALAEIDLEVLRAPFENLSVLKIIHNAAFDAARLEKHYKFKAAPVFDTMLAARRSGERKYSLKAQAETHLDLHLNKSTRTSDWSRRPLDVRQLHYAALDPFATLLIYENQKTRNLRGDYFSKSQINSVQSSLPLEKTLPVETPVSGAPLVERLTASTDLSAEAAAILGIVAELPSRYHPDGLAASIGAERIGLAGWIIDNRLGKNAEPDEETVRSAIADLCERKLIEITASRRMQVTDAGGELWQNLKSAPLNNH